MSSRQIRRGWQVAATVVVSLASMLAVVSNGNAVHAVSVPDAPTLGGTIQVVADNDFALFGGDANNVTRIILQNNDVWMDQITASTTYHISLGANESYLYLLAMGGGGGEDIGGNLNGVDITQIPSGVNGIQRAVSGPNGSSGNGYLLVSDALTTWNYAQGASNAENVAYGKYAAPLSEVQNGLAGATWGDPPSFVSGGVGASVNGHAFSVPSSKAVMFRFKGTSLGSGFATAGDASADVSWSAPANDGGSPILDYMVTAYKASDNSATTRTCTTPNATTRACTVTGLTNGVDYYFKIRARNSVGYSVPSAATASVTPNDFTPPVLSMSANSSSTSATVTYTVSGNEPINCSTLSATAGVDFTVTNGSITSVTQASSTTCSVMVASGLTAGQSANVTLTRASSFSMTDTAGNTQTAVSGSPMTVAVAIPVPTTTTTTTTTTVVVAITVPNATLTLLTPTTTVQPVSQTTTAKASTTSKSSTTSSTSTTTTTLPSLSPRNDAVGAVDATSAPSNVEIPNAPEAAYGMVRATVDGSVVDIQTTRRNNSIVVQSKDFALAATALDGSKTAVPLDSSGSLTVNKANSVKVQTIGLAPSSNVDAWMMSTPTPLGRVKTDLSGAVVGNYKLPALIESGNHRIVLAGETRNGKKIVVSIGVKVPVEKSTVKWSWVFLSLLAIAMLFALLIPARRRREERTNA